MHGVAEARTRQGDARGRRSFCRSSTCSTASPASFRAVSGSASPWAGRWCANPDVFLFDEPLSNLDAKLRVDMRTEIKKLHQKLGTTIVYVTHDQIEAMTLSTRIAVMYDGYVQQLGTPKEIYDTPVQPVRGDLHGLARDERAARAAGGAERRVACRDHRRDGAGASPRIENAPEAYAAYRDKPVILGIRPEAITDPEGADRNARNIQPLSNHGQRDRTGGSDTFVTMTLSGKDCIARMRADADVHPGQSFDFAVNMDKAVLFDPETEKRIGEKCSRSLGGASVLCYWNDPNMRRGLSNGWSPGRTRVCQTRMSSSSDRAWGAPRSRPPLRRPDGAS
jgi:hypothetical protein